MKLAAEILITYFLKTAYKHLYEIKDIGFILRWNKSDESYP